MNFKKIFTFLILIIFLASCSNSEKNNENINAKTSFIIETEKLQNFSNNITTEKSAIITSTSNISINSEWAWYIEKIFYKEWDFVKYWATIATLRDSQNNYDLVLEQAKNNLELQKAQINSQEINLNSQIDNAKITYEKALNNYNSIKNQTNLKYDNLNKENKDKIKNYNDSYKNYLNSIESIMNQYLYDADLVLWLTRENENRNNWFESYLGAYAGDAFKMSQDEWNKVYGSRGEIRARIEKNINFTDSETSEDLKIIENGYERLRILADKMIYMHQNNAYWSTLTPEMSSSWLVMWNNYRNAITSAETNFLNWKNSVNIFLQNYKINEEATKIAIETINRWLSWEEFNILQENSELNLAYKNTSIAINDNITNAKLNLENAEKSLENAKKIKEATIIQLKANLKNAEIALIQAERNASKLIIKSPISGTITKINTEIGEQINIWKKISEISGKSSQAIVELNPQTANLLKIEDEVIAEISGEKIIWKIASISTIPNSNMLSNVRINFENAENFIGQWAKIIFNIKNPEEKNNSYLIPLNSINIIEEWIGQINILENEKIITKNVKLWIMYWKNIEIFSDIDSESIIILSDVSKYNNENQTLEIKNFNN